MPGLITIAELFDKSLSIFGLIRKGKKQKNEKIDHALFALYTALNETKSYVERLASGRRRIRKNEFALAKLWHNASIPLRYVDQELAERCFFKGSYWLESEVWSEHRIRNNKIDIESMIKSTRKLLLK
jgi:hypothetical protein